MPYDFTRFTPQSFERFSQALVARKLGPGVQVFGDGPDGAREASFEGQLDIQTHGARWNGYVVVQAKFRMGVHSENKTDDAAWLERELKEEFSKFENSSRNLRAPEYYLVITNSVLTPAASRKVGDRRVGAGGQERIDNYFNAMKDELGLKGWLIWHADTLSAMLDTEQELRRRYSAWVTEGDVLSAALESLMRPEMLDVVPLSLKRDLKKDRDVRRKDAGQVTDKRIFVDDVFVDLPLNPFAEVYFEPMAVTELEFEEDEEFDASIDTAETAEEFDDHDDADYEVDYDEDVSFGDGVVARLLERAGDKLDPESLSLLDKRRPRPNRIVLLGGPGQGKSTLGQFVVQIFRAAAVLACKNPPPADETREAAEAIFNRSKSEGLNINVARRFPLHLDLPKYADALKRCADRGEDLSILRFATTQLERGADVALHPTDLRKWLGNYPWLVVMDGLDEVPATGNRTDVIAAINAFWDDVHEVNGDVLVLVTTPPQGYGDDLARRHWEHWPMANLRPNDAMRFANRLADVLLSDESRKEEILGQLKRASADPATAPIMVSPLQVAILFSLVETRGGVPADRWTLFQRHYTLLRDREAAKDGEPAQILRDYTTQIDQIHYDAGFLLHVRAEKSGTADSYLTEEEFEKLVINQLQSEGYESRQIAEVKSKIVTIATQRLVLLGSKTGGQIAFDVRSLQEFMAAARIMSSPEAKILNRLVEIASRTHWRHVFRISASKAFALAELAHLRSHIISVCDSLNQGDKDETDKVAYSGAMLALDLLADNVAVRLPQHRRSLVARALKLLDAGPKSLDLRLEAYIDSDTAQTFEDFIAPCLSNVLSQAGRSAWKLLTFIANGDGKHNVWASKFLIKNWPKEGEQLVSLLGGTEALPAVGSLQTFLRASLIDAGPAVLSNWFDRFGFPKRDPGPEVVRDLSVLLTQPDDLLTIRSRDGEAAKVRIAVGSMVPLDISIPDDLKNHPRWKNFMLVKSFQSDPNEKSLAAAVRALAKRGSSALPGRYIPWPVASVMASVRDTSDVEDVAQAVEDGAFGDQRSWKDAELRWRNSGVIEGDMAMWRAGKFIAHDISVIGVPFPNNITVQAGPGGSNSILDVFIELLSKLNPRIRADQLVIGASRLAIFSDEGRKDALLTILLGRFRDGHLQLERITRSVVVFLSRMLLRGPDNENLFDLCEAMGRLNSPVMGQFSAAARKILLGVLRTAPHRRGLIPLIVSWRTAHQRDGLALSEMPDCAFEFVQGDAPSIRAAVAWLRFVKTHGQQDSVEATCADIFNGAYHHVLSVAEYAVNLKESSQERVAELLRQMCKRAAFSNAENYGDLLTILKRIADARQSNMGNANLTQELELPALQSIAVAYHG